MANGIDVTPRLYTLSQLLITNFDHSPFSVLLGDDMRAIGIIEPDRLKSTSQRNTGHSMSFVFICTT